MEKLLSPNELAVWLGVPRSTVYAWNYKGAGPKRIRVGKAVRYRPSEVERWLSERETAGGPA
jgi:excisionase family DNA binding protein